MPTHTSPSPGTPGTAASSGSGAPPQQSLTHQTARGFVYFFVQSIGAIVLNGVRGLVLAVILGEHDFGVFGMAAAIAAIGIVLRVGGVREVLVQRHAHFRRWSGPAFWLSLSVGFVAGGVVAGLAPLAGLWYQQPEVVDLILILAITLPLVQLETVPEAYLRGELRFRALAVIEMVWITLLAGGSVVFALLGFGAKSFVLPDLIAEPAKLILMWAAARPPLRWRVRLRRWRFLFTDSMLLLATGFVDMLTQVGDFLLLGRFHPAPVVGLYQFAYSLSRRPMQLFARNLMAALFPALSTLQDERERQVKAFLRAGRLLGLVGMPACLLVGAAADPAVRAILPAKWIPAIPALQVLSVATALRMVGWSARSLIRAQGRFGATLVIGIVYLVPFLALVALAAWLGGDNAPVMVALAVAISSAVLGPAYVFIAIKPGGGTWRDVWRLHAAPLAISLVSVVPAWIAAELLPAMPARDWVRLATVMGVSGAIYLPLIRRVAPDAWNELISRVGAFRPRRRAAAA